MDRDSDSDQSHEMFSDDETVIIADNNECYSPKTDSSCISCTQLVRSINTTPIIKKAYQSPVIPKTPLSLGPFISKAEVWTSDLETPESKNINQYNNISAGVANNRAQFQTFDDKSLAITATPLRNQDTSSVDDIIPASPTISDEHDKKRLNRRILKYVSSNSSNTINFDKRCGTENTYIVNEDHPYDQLDSSEQCINRPCSITLENYVKQLKIQQNQRTKIMNNKYKIPDEEFMKSLKNLPHAQTLTQYDRAQGKMLTNRQIGFVPLSQIAKCLDDEHDLSIQSIEGVQEEKFHGFSRECQDKSQKYTTKFYNTVSEQRLHMHNKLFKANHFLGFTRDEIEQTYNTAKRHKYLYSKYLNENHRLSKRPVTKLNQSPLPISINTGIKTAYGREIFIDFDLISQSRSMFLDFENNFSMHNIDELLKCTDVSPPQQTQSTPKKIISLQKLTTNETEELTAIKNNHIDDSGPTNYIDNTNEFKDPLIVTFAAMSHESINNSDNINMMAGFKTARGTNLHVSKEALIHANGMFNRIIEEDSVNLESDIKSDMLPQSKALSRNEEVVSLSNNKIETVPVKDNKILHEKLSEIKVPSVDTNNSLVNNSTSNPLMGFQTGRGKHINISKDALLGAKAAFLEDMKDDIPPVETHFIMSHQKENFNYLSNMQYQNVINKRKQPADNTMDDTPVGRKKARMGTDLQRRKLFDEIADEDNYLVESELFLNDNDHIETDRNIINSKLQGESSNVITVAKDFNTTNIISNEVRESIAALLKDEEICSETLEPWSSNSATEMKLMRNRWSDKTFGRVCDKNLEKRSKSYPMIENTDEQLTSIKTSDNTGLPMKSLSPKNDDIPEDVFFESPFFDDIIDPYIMELNRQKRSTAIIKQQALIDLKKKHRVHHRIRGSLLQLKETNDRISLRDLFKDGVLVERTEENLSKKGIDPCILSINSETAVTYQFRCDDIFGKIFMNNHFDGVPLSDNAILIPNDDNLAGVKEFKQCLLACPGVDPFLVPNGYVENHFRWIVWKLASMDKLKANENMFLKFLTPDNVMRQLKYRYDREIDNSQRSALRRILEKDDVPSRRLVLCVSQVFSIDNDDNTLVCKSDQKGIELTDGWYSVRATIDYAMLDNIKSGKVRVGTKLMTYGAELLNLNDGCYPLDIPSNVRLKIHTNSTRRVKWDTKLGYQRQCGPMKCTLKSIHPNGGLIGKFTVGIARVYPIIYREKFGNGQFYDRNARCEEKISIAYEAERQSRIDEALCVNSQAYTSEFWKTEIEKRLMKDLPIRRDVTPIAKIKVAHGNDIALITLWSGAEESQSIFKENSYITICNALASGKKLNELQITANRCTAFMKPTLTPYHITCPSRIFTSLDETYNLRFNPHYGEFDTVGIIVSIGPAPHGMKNFETANLAFKHNESNDTPSFYLSVLFWQGISSYGFSDIVTVGSFIACCNLQWRKNTYKSIPTAFCTERTVLTRSPKQKHLCQPFDNLRTIIKDPWSYVNTCALAIQTEIIKKSKSPLGPAIDNNNSRAELYNLSYSTPSTLHSHRTPYSARTSDDSKNFDTPNNTIPNIMKPMTIKDRIDKLRNYGTPPKLSPIQLPQMSKIALGYRSPMLQSPLTLSKPQSK